MSESTSSVSLTPDIVHRLVNVEYSMIAAGSELVDLAEELEALVPHLPACRVAAHQVKRLRTLLGIALESLDGPITEAARMMEEQGQERTYTEEEEASIPF